MSNDEMIELKIVMDEYGNLFAVLPNGVLKDKQEETTFEVGDEIEIVDPTTTSHGKKRIITKVGVNSIHLIDPATFNVTWIEKEHAKKTGKHYDAIPFNWKGENE